MNELKEVAADTPEENGTKCTGCGRIIPDGQMFHSDLKYDENWELAGLENELCQECAKKIGAEINSIV